MNLFQPLVVLGTATVVDASTTAADTGLRQRANTVSRSFSLVAGQADTEPQATYQEMR